MYRWLVSEEKWLSLSDVRHVAPELWRSLCRLRRVAERARLIATDARHTPDQKSQLVCIQTTAPQATSVADEFSFKQLENQCVCHLQKDIALFILLTWHIPYRQTGYLYTARPMINGVTVTYDLFL